MLPDTLEFSSPPSLPKQYVKALFKRSQARRAVTIPRIEARVASVRIDRQALAAYRKLCGFPREETVPITYPQVMAVSLHTAIMLDERFPYQLYGIVHVRNRFEQTQPLSVDTPYELRAFVEGSREVKSGVEFDLVTRLLLEGTMHWESVTTVLVRTRTGESHRPPQKVEPVRGDDPDVMRSTIWRVLESTGRDYSRVAGDYNPIHLHALGGKLFGFPRAIVQGMWSVARAVAALDDVVPSPGIVEVEFKRPILLPSSVLFTAKKDGSSFTFSLEKPDHSSTYVVGKVARRTS